MPEITRENLNKAADTLKSLGITPMDLWTIEYLFQIEASTREFTGIDLNMHFGFREEVTKALVRKAELLAREGNSSYTEVLERMGLTG